MNWKAAKTSALLSLFFIVVYGTTNRLTGLRGNVPSYFFGWERGLPFVAAMILPYMSIDLFFIAAPFACGDDRERRVLARRLIAAILIAAACFLLLPLRFAFPRPYVDGWLGAIFNNFRELDQPFNQFPSLHIAIQIILLAVYLCHTRGVVRFALCAWFALIAASTVLTYQHHVIDVAGGLALGTLCIYFFQDQPLRAPVVRNARIGVYYLGGALVVAAAAFGLRPCGWLLLWPAISLALVAAAYFHLGPGIFRKREGVLPSLTRLVLGPVLLGQRISLAYYTSRTRRWDVISDGLWISRKLSDDEAREAVESGVTAVVDVTAEFSEARPFRTVHYRQMPVLDLTAPTAEQLDEAVEFISTHVEGGGVVCVHCKAGYSRAAAVVGAYLLAAREARNVEEAVSMLRAARPRIVIRPEAMRALREYSEHLAADRPQRESPALAFAGAPSPIALPR